MTWIAGALSLAVTAYRTVAIGDPPTDHSNLASVEGISGRNTKYGLRTLLGLESYSQEVTVVLSDFLSREWVYKGVGEYMGRTELDDIKGALSAALAGLC